MISLVSVLLALVSFLFLAACFGRQLLRVTGVQFEAPAENLLCSVALGSLLLQTLFFLSQFTGHIRPALLVVLFAAMLISIKTFGEVWRWLSMSSTSIAAAPAIEKYMLGLIAATLALEFLAAMAPLTASDALHYHFATPLLVLREGLKPNFFLSHSFFTGQGHSFILFGLAFGSERLAVGLLFCGGLLSAFSIYVLAKSCMSNFWALLASLLFVLTPLVAWQISSGGAPDLWMSFFSTTAVLLISDLRKRKSWGLTVVIGVLAGGIAGIKYTGCYAAFALAIAVLIESGSFFRTMLFGISAFLAGVWPYLRNALWTGDPVFPFSLQKLDPARINSAAMNFYLQDTGAAVHHSISQILRYLTFSWIDPARVGFWQFFGPLILAFLPFVFLAIRNTPIWRVILVVWLVTGLGLGLSSGMTRFLLVIYPIALVAAVAGIRPIFDRQRKTARILAAASVSFFLVGSAAGFLAYAAPALSCSIGLVSKSDYLRDRAPDYQLADFINRSLQDKAGQKRVLVFFRHVYFLNVPFIYGNPRASWGVDPSRLQTSAEWSAFLQENSIGWVVRSPDYPPSLANSLGKIEREGMLTPVMQSEVEGFQGKRSSGIRERVNIVILRVSLPSENPHFEKTRHAPSR